MHSCSPSLLVDPAFRNKVFGIRAPQRRIAIRSPWRNHYYRAFRKVVTSHSCISNSHARGYGNRGKQTKYFVADTVQIWQALE